MKNTIKILLAALVVAATAIALAESPACSFWLVLTDANHYLPAIEVDNETSQPVSPTVTPNGGFTVLVWEIRDGFRIKLAEPGPDTNYTAGAVFGTGPWPNTNIVSCPVPVTQYWQAYVIHCQCPTNGAQVSLTPYGGSAPYTNAPVTPPED
jgi:hypothetical protein